MMRTKNYLTVIILACLCMQGYGQYNITIDGKIDKAEWSDQGKTQLVDEGEGLFIRQDAHYYYIGLRSNTNGTATVLLHTGDSLLLLHASAAIGTAYYKIENANKATLLSGFSSDPAFWCFRDPAYRKGKPHVSPQQVAEELNVCLSKMGWAANTHMMGSLYEFEYVIDKKICKRGARICALVPKKSAGNTNPTLIKLPENARVTADDAIDQQLHSGYNFDTLNTQFQNWIVLQPPN